LDPRIEYAAMHNGVVCVSGRIKYLELWTLANRLIRELLPIDLWHNDIGKQKDNVFTIT
jgi:hypothetical protein